MCVLTCRVKVYLGCRSLFFLPCVELGQWQVASQVEPTFRPLFWSWSWAFPDWRLSRKVSSSSWFWACWWWGKPDAAFWAKLALSNDHWHSPSWGGLMLKPRCPGQRLSGLGTRALRTASGWKLVWRLYFDANYWPPRSACMLIPCYVNLLKTLFLIGWLKGPKPGQGKIG